MQRDAPIPKAGAGADRGRVVARDETQHSTAQVDGLLVRDVAEVPRYEQSRSSAEADRALGIRQNRAPSACSLLASTRIKAVACDDLELAPAPEGTSSRPRRPRVAALPLEQTPGRRPSHRSVGQAAVVRNRAVSASGLSPLRARDPRCRFDPPPASSRSPDPGPAARRDARYFVKRELSADMTSDPWRGCLMAEGEADSALGRPPSSFQRVWWPRERG